MLARGVAGVPVPGVNPELGGASWGKGVRAPWRLKWIRKVLI